MWEDDSCIVSSPSYLYNLDKEHFDLVKGLISDCDKYDSLIFVKIPFACNVYGDTKNGKIFIGEFNISSIDKRIFELSKRSITYRPLECLNYNLAY